MSSRPRDLQRRAAPDVGADHPSRRRVALCVPDETIAGGKGVSLHGELVAGVRSYNHGLAQVTMVHKRSWSNGDPQPVARHCSMSAT